MPEGPTILTVGLALIARDEQETLPRLLVSCDGAFDEVVLVDTGSIDATVERFQEWAATQPGTRCRVESFTWVDHFGAARQAALDSLTTDWCVWADCDDVLHGTRSLRAIAAAARDDVAGLTCRYDYSPTEHARHIRLLRSGAGRWQGAIHEVLDVRGRVEDVPDDVVRWEHLPPPSDGVKPRMRRDLEILEREHRAHPEDARTVFYLAQTCRDLGDTVRAVELYERRAGMPGWDEETFYARYQAGKLLAESGDWPRGMTTLVAAWELRPERLEPVQVLSAQLRTRGEHHAAHLFALHGLGKPAPPDHLFVAQWVYDWGMLFEYSITAYWVGEMAAALAACDKLLANPRLPPAHREQTIANRRFCVDAIARAAAARHVRLVQHPA